MNGWFSASAHQAILKDGKRYYLVLGSEQGKARQVTAKEATMLSEEWPDIYTLKVKSKAEAQNELQRAAWSYDALLASSIAIDGRVNDNRRERAAIEADRLLKEEYASNHVLNAYSSHPMPDSADLLGASRICDEKNLEALGKIIKTVQLYQDSIRATRAAWEAIDQRRFGRLKERAIFQTIAVRSGLFVSLVKRIGDTKKCEGFLQSENKPSVRTFPHSRRVLTQWLTNANQYAARPSQLLPAFTETPVAANTPAIGEKGRAPTAHTGVSRVTDAFP